MKLWVISEQSTHFGNNTQSLQPNFRGEWPSVVVVRIGRLPAQTPLSARPGLGTQLR